LLKEKTKAIEDSNLLLLILKAMFKF